MTHRKEDPNEEFIYRPMSAYDFEAVPDTTHKEIEDIPDREWPAGDFVPTPPTPFVSLLSYDEDEEEDHLPFPYLFKDDEKQ